MTVRTIVFDFGNVLGFFSRRKAAEQLAALAPHQVDLDQLTQFLFYTEMEPRLEVSEVSGTEFLEMVRNEFGLVGSTEQLAMAFADMFTPNQVVCDLVPRLRGRYRLALLSNTNELHYAVFRKQFADTLDQFDHLVVSHEAKLRKPDLAIFAHLASKVDTSPEECLFIDDLPANIEGARLAGWQTILYRPGDDLASSLRLAGVLV